MVNIVSWTEARLALVRDLFAAGKTDREMAHRLGVSLGTLKARRQNMGLLRPRAHLDWSAPKISALIELWGTKMSATEIADRLGVTKSAVLGKAHRLGLPQRNSPLCPSQKPRPPEPLTLANINPGQCLWPEGDPKHEGFHFCGAPITFGKPYCSPHCERAYIKEGKDAAA